MMIEVTKDKRKKMLEELSHWHKGRKSFIIMQSVKILSTLEYWVDTTPWVCFMLFALRESVNRALRTSKKLIHNNAAIKQMILAVAKNPDLDDAKLQNLFPERKIAKDVYMNESTTIKVHIQVKECRT